MSVKTIIFDIDGTLADVEHRRRHVATKPKRWDLFFKEMDKDPPVKDIVALHALLSLAEDYYYGDPPYCRIVYCSGRGEEYRDVTVEWLRKHVRPFDEIDLRMRPANDSRPDQIIKKEMLDALRAEGHDILFAVDDRQRVVDMWRENGVTCLQAAPGDFDEPSKPYYTPTNGETLLHLMVGPSGSGKSTYLRNLIASGKIAAESVISSDSIRAEMCGDIRDQSQNAAVFAYLHDAVKVRLNYGLPTYIDATHIKRADRLAAVALAPTDTRVEYIVVNRRMDQKMRDGGWRLDVVKDGKTLVELHDQTFKSNLRDIHSGDDLPNVFVSIIPYRTIEQYDDTNNCC